MTIEDLNSKYGIAAQLEIREGQGGLPIIAIDTGRATARISVYAGQLLSWRPTGQAEDLLFLSDQAYYAPGKAIKGGVPICWPWFGPDPEGKGRPGHGFVRNRPWELRGTTALVDGSVQVRLGLTDSDETRAIWPHAFDLELQISVSDTLGMTLVTRNQGSDSFMLSQALHSYFRVGDIGQVQVHGLDGKTYIDKMDGGNEKTQSGGLAIGGEVDRIYTGVDADLAIEDPAFGRRIEIAATGSTSAVVWNPWAATAAAMADLGDQDYQQLLCVETANAGPDVISVPAGGEHRLAVTYRLA